MGLLNILKAQSESEPNNSCATSNLIQIDQWVSARMAVFGYLDYDYFQLEITEPGQYLIEFNSDTAGILPSLVLAGFNDCVSITGASPENDSNYLNPVFYFLVNDPGTLNISFSKKQREQVNYNYKFRIIRVNLDSYEPDNTLARSNTIQIGDTVHAHFNGYTLGSNTLNPYSEDDWYSVQITQKGILFPRLIKVPPGKNSKVSIYTADSLLVAQNCCFLPGLPMNCLQQLLCDPGQYFIQVSFADTVPAYKRIDIPGSYQLIVDFIPDSTECNQTLISATSLTLGSTYDAFIGGKIGKNKDFDIYKIQTDKPGNLILDIWDQDSTSEKYITFLDKDSVVIFSGYYYAHYFISFSPQSENAHLYFLCSSDSYYIVVEEKAQEDCNDPRLYSSYQIRANVYVEDTTECNNHASETRLIPCQTDVSGILNPAYDIDRFWVKVPKRDTFSFYVEFSYDPIFLRIELDDRKFEKASRYWYIYESGKISFFNFYDLEDFVISVTRSNPRFDQEPMPYKIIVDCPEKSTHSSTESNFEIEFYPIDQNFYFLHYSDFENLTSKDAPFIYNILGHKMILPIERKSEGWSLDANYLSTGIYFLHFSLNGNSYVKKFFR